MELKPFNAALTLSYPPAFNRTTMELKPRHPAYCRSAAFPFNRTTMELKLAMASSAARLYRPLLIEPLWNWNTALQYPPVIVPLPFNRTTMELKRTRWYEQGLRQSHLLIEPLWNWNSRMPSSSCFVIFLLIEPLWNWNSQKNRRARYVSYLLIEPLWNWNYKISTLYTRHSRTFNRTTMELKHSKGAHIGMLTHGF